MGTGDQGIPPEDAADETLNLIRRWVDTAPGLKHVRVFAYDLQIDSRPWMFSHLKLLQTCGNSFAHPSTFRLASADIAAVLIAATRFAGFVDRELKSVAKTPS